ncbi:MAG TPA: hypothetical protein VF622_13840 [Segetibacter sp.]|jgi:hypothetical protein
MAKKIKNLQDLAVDLLTVYGELRDGKIDKSTADALANIAGKVINSLKVQVEYNSIKTNIDKVQLLETPPVKALLTSVEKKEEAA